ncbi:reverse transcriptase domain-containing protein, partial [Tanacetum coccineum]
PALPALLFIPLLVDRSEDTPEAELPPRKRLCLTARTSRYKVGESLTAAPRLAGGHGIEYRFIGTLDTKTRRQRAEEVGYGIRDTWVEPKEVAEEIAPVTLEGVNTRVTELVTVQEQDTQDIYDVIEDAQDRQTWIFQSVEALIDDRQYHYETTRLLDQEALVSREAWAHSMGFMALTAQVSSLQGHLAMALGEIRALQARDQARADVPEGTAIMANNMPPRRSSATAKAAAATARAAAAAAASMTVAAIEQLIEARDSAALANHETLRNRTNGHGDRSHNSGTRNRGTTRTPHELFHISNCAMKNQVKFATCTFVRNALTWWNSHMKDVTQDVAYAMDWKTLKKMMTAKYCPRGKIKKLEIKLWTLKVKGTDILGYTLCFQELALMCGRMFLEESYEIEKYVGGLPDMIWGNVMSYRPQTMEEAIEFANDQMDQKLGHQQQNKRQNTRRAYIAGPGEKKEYTGSLPLCTKCNYHHKGPCAPRCNKCKKIDYLARDCRGSGPNGNNNNQGNSRTTQNAGTCYECGVQGHFKRECPNESVRSGQYGDKPGLQHRYGYVPYKQPLCFYPI